MFVYLYNGSIQAVLFTQIDMDLLFQSSEVSGCLSSHILFGECMNRVPSVHSAYFRYGDFSGGSCSYHLNCTKASFENFWRLQSSGRVVHAKILKRCLQRCCTGDKTETGFVQSSWEGLTATISCNYDAVLESTHSRWLKWKQGKIYHSYLK